MIRHLLAAAGACVMMHAALADEAFLSAAKAMFANPPKTAHVGVWWHWMGRQVSKEGIVKDLDWMVRMGINSATIFGMADATTPWAKRIANIPTDIGEPYSDTWWGMVKFACAEGRKRQIEIGLHNCPGYTSTGGKWIPSSLAMRELVFAKHGTKPKTTARPHACYPVYNEDKKVFESPDCPARLTDVQFIGTARGYDIYHAPNGSFIQPCDWANFGLECDKMNPEAIRAHLDAVFAEWHRHLGPDFRAAGLTHVLLDSYEAGTPNWTPKMREEFRQRRGYDCLDYLPILGGHTNGYAQAEVARFKQDFDRTVKDLYRDVLFKEMFARVHAEGLDFSCEPYIGPFEPGEVAPYIDRLMFEFWFSGGMPKIYDQNAWSQFKGPAGQRHNVIEAEAFTGSPDCCAFTETPAQLKQIGDRAFLKGINRFILHSVVHQPWGDDVKPGVTMGRWGTHFGRNQVWGETEKRWFDYVTRCQALLQFGEPSEARLPVPFAQLARARDGKTIFFLVNTSKKEVALTQKGAWFDPVSGKVTSAPTFLAPTQSGFLVPDIATEGTPDPYSIALFTPKTTWADLLAEDADEPQDVEYAPAPMVGGNMMLAYPDWFKQGMKARPTKRKWFATWDYEIKRK